jgi:hypothetical protein
MLYAKKIAQGKGVIIPEDAKANSAIMSAWIDLQETCPALNCCRAKLRIRGVPPAAISWSTSLQIKSTSADRGPITSPRWWARCRTWTFAV